MSDLFSFLTFVLLSRFFGEHYIGQYSLAIAITGFFAAFSEFGLNNYSIKTINVAPDRIQEITTNILVIRVIFSIVSFSLLLVISPYFGRFDNIYPVLIAIGLFQISYSLFVGIQSIFISLEKVFIAGILEFLLRLLTFIIVLVLSLKDFNFSATVLTFPIASLSILLFSSVILYHKYVAIKLSLINKKKIIEYIKESSYYFGSEFLQLLSNRTDVIIIGFFLGVSASGFYNASYRVIFLLMMLPRLLSVAFLPSSTRLFADPKYNLNRIFYQVLFFSILVSVPAVFGIILISNDLIIQLYGVRFERSIAILQLLSLLFLSSFFRFVVGFFLIACNLQEQRFKFQCITSVLNLVLNFSLVPTIGIEGAAISAITSETVLTILFLYKIRQVITTRSLFSAIAISLLSSLAFFVPFKFFYNINFIICIVISTAIYLSINLLIPFNRRMIFSVYNLKTGESF